MFLNAVSKGGERECLATFLTSDSARLPQLFATHFTLFLLGEVVFIRWMEVCRRRLYHLNRLYR